MNERELERMIVRIVGDTAQYQSAVTAAQGVTKGFADHIRVASERVSAFGMSIRGFGATATAAVLPLLGVGSAVRAAFKGVSLAATAEENRVAFGMMLRDAEKGTKMVADIQAMAARTPLNTSDLEQSAKMLLQFGIAGRNVIPVMKLLGDVSGGNAQRFQQMTYAFSQMSSTGRLMGGDLMQMVNAGFNPLAELARTSGKSIGYWRDQVEQGRVTLSMVVDAMKSATSEGGTMAGAMEKQSQTISGLFSTMQDDIDASLRTIGEDVIRTFDLKGLTRDVSSVVQAFTAWFASVDAGTKSTVAAFAVVGVGIAALVAGAVLLFKVVTLALGGLNILVAAAAVGFVGLTAVLTDLTVSVGGLAAAWGRIKQAAADAWAWLEPVRSAVYDLLATALQQAQTLWDGVKSSAVAAWTAIVGDTHIEWERIRKTIVDAVQFAEFTLLNFQQVAKYAWTAIQLGAEVLAQEVDHFFAAVLPAYLDFFRENWVEVLSGVLTFQAEVFANMAANIASFVEGGFSLDNPWIPLETSLQRTLQRVPEVAARGMSTLERSLREDVLRQGRAIEGSFADFQAGKVVAPSTEAATAATQAGVELGNSMTAGLKSEIQKLDATTFGSAEALARFTEFKEKVQLNVAPEQRVAREMEPVATNATKDVTEDKERTKLLKDIRESVQSRDRKTAWSVQPVGV